MTQFRFSLKTLFLLVPFFFLNAQKFTKQDSLRGQITSQRAWWDLKYYHLDIKIEPDTKFISGKNTVQYQVLKKDSVLQIDLQAPMKLLKAVQGDKALEIKQDGNAHYITLKEVQNVGSINKLDVYYEGHPKEAQNAPWNGGISWKKDKNDKHFIASSCQGLGASAWWPCKDHMYDEVDSMLISVNVPDKLFNVSNGRLKTIEHIEDTKTYHWFVKNPINNYGVNINIGDYSNFSESYQGEAGFLDMDYYVLSYNLEKAKIHFKEAPKMMKAFEHWFGPYPFYSDSFKLVEAPYLGMEHQSSVTYGNNYKNGYLGKDLSGTGWGLKFDFIIVHESGHEWFANNITYKDAADMWIHEGFTAYSESLFLEYYYGKKAAEEYLIGTRKTIKNDKPIIGIYGVNKRGSEDMYYKAANMLHTLRQIIKDDEKWREILRKMNLTFHHKTVTTKQIEDFISNEAHLDLKLFFSQYLRQTNPPTLKYFIKKRALKYRWINTVDGFNMPVEILINGNPEWIYPTTELKTKTVDHKIDSITINPNFYIKTKS